MSSGQTAARALINYRRVARRMMPTDAYAALILRFTMPPRDPDRRS